MLCAIFNVKKYENQQVFHEFWALELNKVSCGHIEMIEYEKRIQLKNSATSYLKGPWPCSTKDGPWIHLGQKGVQ